MIERLREQRAAFEEVDRAAEQGDQVNINFLGTKDGEAFEGGSAEGVKLKIGSGQFIPGFEEQLGGVKKGEEKTIEVTFPEDYGAKELAGKEATFDLTIKAVKDFEPNFEHSFKSLVEDTKDGTKCRTEPGWQDKPRSPCRRL